MKKILLVLSAIFAVLATVSFAVTGEQVMDQMVNTNSNFKTQKILMNMTIQAKGQQDKNYSLVIYVYNNKTSGKKYALIRFTSPQSVKGLSFLSLGKDNEYLYMPAYHRVERVAGSLKNSKFAGSDFTYSDLSLLYSQKESGKYTIVTENSDEYVLSILPSDSNAEYSKLMMNVVKSHMLPTKVQFYKDGKLYKTLYASSLKEVNGRWIFKNIKLEMANGSSKTFLTLASTKFNLNIPVSFFSVRTLFLPVLKY